MQKRLLRSAAVIIALLGHVTVARAQSAADQAAVRRAALDYLEGFYEGDSAKLARSVWPEVRKWGYWKNDASSPYAGSAMPYARFLTYAADVKSGKIKVPANPPKEVTVYEVQDQTAAVKVTAHWGTDYLLLAKERDRWMITHVLWQGPLKK
jgi:hypothetical protein